MSTWTETAMNHDIHTDEDINAYNTNHNVFKGGLSKQEVAQYYNKWAENGGYDQDLNPTRYTGPEQAARRVADHFPENERSAARILDVAAGTGRIGQELSRLGFCQIEALEPSEGMLRKAKERGVYTDFIQDFIGGEHRVPRTDGFYDALACSGGFGDGHIPASALYEMIRIVKKGGLICIAMREEYLHLVAEYKNTLHPLMVQLETDGKWKLKAKEVIDKYFLSKTGMIFQYVVL